MRASKGKMNSAQVDDASVCASISFSKDRCNIHTFYEFFAGGGMARLWEWRVAPNRRLGCLGG